MKGIFYKDIDKAREPLEIVKHCKIKKGRKPLSLSLRDNDGGDAELLLEFSKTVAGVRRCLATAVVFCGGTEPVPKP